MFHVTSYINFEQLDSSYMKVQVMLGQVKKVFLVTSYTFIQLEYRYSKLIKLALYDPILLCFNSRYGYQGPLHSFESLRFCYILDHIKLYTKYLCKIFIRESRLPITLLLTKDSLWLKLGLCLSRSVHCLGFLLHHIMIYRSFFRRVQILYGSFCSHNVCISKL